MSQRTPAAKKARELAKYLRTEQPDYAYLKNVFYHLRRELEISVPRAPKTLPTVPSEADIRRYYATVWQAQNFADMVLIKTLLYTGVRVGELVHIKLTDVDWTECHIRITAGKGHKDRIVPYPPSFKEALGMYAETLRQRHAVYLFESRLHHKYSERGVRRILERYSVAAGLPRTIAPHQLRHFLLTWLKRQGIDDALIQPYSGHAVASCSKFIPN